MITPWIVLHSVQLLPVLQIMHPGHDKITSDSECPWHGIIVTGINFENSLYAFGKIKRDSEFKV